jgi:phosphatidylserine/phosphatidylglycerophosphate/cardiolipin synthase-like enzyme
LPLARLTRAWPCRARACHSHAPVENLEHVDVALIDRAEHEIDIAAYVQTDWPVMQALTRAADRGVHISIYLDGAQLAPRDEVENQKEIRLIK